MAKKQYYDIKPLLDTCPKAAYYILYGQRANGKSYQVKLKCLTEAYEGLEAGKNKFIYLRRWQKDIKQDSVSAYFGDMPIKKITKGEYEGVTAYQGSLYFYYLDDNDKMCKSEPIGRYLALNEAERYKSQTFVGYKYIIYEEFITSAIYLDDEATKLMQLISTIARHAFMQTFLIGNTISRLNPYWDAWGINIKRISIGQIQVYHFYTEGSSDPIDVAVEYCANANYDNKLFFGQPAKQIVSGEWEVHEKARLPKSRDEYMKAYEICVEYQSFKFVCELLIDLKTSSPLVFIYPLTSRRRVNRIITDKFSDNILISPYLDLKKRPEAVMNECFRTNKVCYSDNLTAADFTHVHDVFRFGQLF